MPVRTGNTVSVERMRPAATNTDQAKFSGKGKKAYKKSFFVLVATLVAEQNLGSWVRRK